MQHTPTNLDALLSRYSMLPMNVPQPVMSLAIMAKSREASGNFSKALSRFTREDPTFKVSPASQQAPHRVSPIGHTLLLY